MDESFDNRSNPSVSVAICTRNRGAAIVDTIQSILSATSHFSELIIVDQSTQNDTEDVVAPFTSQIKIKYHRSNTTGLGKARNVALSLAKGDIVAFTDDDCLVTPNWLDSHIAAFVKFPNVILTYGAVEVPEYDKTKGYIPEYKILSDRHVTDLFEKRYARGIGANTAARRKEIMAMGGYDNLFGPGGRLCSADDVDMTIRVVMKSHEVYETKDSVVIHEGYRDRKAGRRHSTNDMIGIGAACAKPVKAGTSGAWSLILEEFGKHTFRPLLFAMFRRRPPLGVYRVLGFLSGFIRGLRYSIDQATFRYHDPANSESEHV